MEIGNIAKEVMEELDKKLKAMKHVNIIVAGKTGVGKSTLINAVFREKLASTGIGAPVTRHIKELSKPNFPLRIYDTVGLELSSSTQSQAYAEIKKIMDDSFKETDPDRHIHCIWYCISVDSNRVEPSEEKFIRLLSDGEGHGVPVIVVLTLAHNLKKSKEMKAYVDSLNLPVKGCFVVLAEDYEDEDFLRRAYGTCELSEFTADCLPELSRDSFANVQRASMELKRRRAISLINTTTAASFAEGFIPLPFSDAAALIPTQISMIASITTIYGVSVDKGMMYAILSSLLGTTGATITGRTVVGALFKFFPGLGTAVGGAITGATAAMITAALGKTYMSLMEMLLKGEIKKDELSSSVVSEKLRTIFSSFIKMKK